MSVNASKHELNQLIYRHLKEHGFHSAADELQRHITQEETNISVSLLDIYKSWLNDSKRKKKSNSTKRSKTGEQTTPTKAKSATPRKKTDKPGKKTVSQKKSAPAKKKKGEDKAAGNVITAEKSKLQPSDKAVAAGGEDSDSSLDVEKWKNLIQQMTEDDIAKMEIINSLDSSAPQPPQKRVRKPREKPPAKTDIPVQQDNGTVEKSNKVGEKTVTKTPVKERTPKKTGANNTENVSSNTPTQMQNLNTVDGKTATSTLLPAKQTHLQTTIPQTPRGQTTAEAPSEPKKKKKHKKDKETKENKVEINSTEAGNDGKEKDSEPVKEKAKAAGIREETGEDVMEKNKINSENNSESIFQEKKAKKRKKEKSGSEENPSDTADVKKEKKKKRIVDSEGNSEPVAEEINETKEQALTNTTQVNSEGEIQQNVEEKKVKKKKKKAHTEGNLELVTEELKEDGNQNAEEKVKKKKNKLYSGGSLELTTGEVTENIDENVEENKGNSDQTEEQKKGKKIKSVDTQEYSEEIVEKKAKKKKRKNPDEDYSEQSVKDDKSEAGTREGTQVQTAEDMQKKTNYATDAESLPPSSRETDSPPKKKKKKKLKSDEVPETAAVSSTDATETIHPMPGDTHKKKKKSSKIKES